MMCFRPKTKNEFICDCENRMHITRNSTGLKIDAIQDDIRHLRNSVELLRTCHSCQDIHAQNVKINKENEALRKELMSARNLLLGLYTGTSDSSSCNAYLKMDTQ